MNDDQQYELDLIQLEKLQDDLETVIFNKKMESRRSNRELKELTLEIEYYNKRINAYIELTK
jgi:hypothetical protein